MGALLKSTVGTAEALASYERALAIGRKLADAHPDVTPFLDDLARSLSAVGSLRMMTGKPAEVLAAL